MGVKRENYFSGIHLSGYEREGIGKQERKKTNMYFSRFLSAMERRCLMQLTINHNTTSQGRLVNI